MSKICSDVDYCLGCGYLIGIENKKCDCFCHSLKEWIDESGSLHEILKNGNERITFTTERGFIITRELKKEWLNSYGSIYE